MSKITKNHIKFDKNENNNKDRKNNIILSKIFKYDLFYECQ